MMVILLCAKYLDTLQYYLLINREIVLYLKNQADHWEVVRKRNKSRYRKNTGKEEERDNTVIYIFLIVEII